MDSKFSVITLRSTPNPQQLVWLALHQDYCEDYVINEIYKAPLESEAGTLVIKHLLAGNKGHWGCFEHPQISLNVGYFPHSTMQQIRTHRIGISVDCQSFRYTGKRILDVAYGNTHKHAEDVYYLRPVGPYTDRFGAKYTYSEEQRNKDLDYCIYASKRYADAVAKGLSYEHARSLIPFDVRQHWVLSVNARSLMHLLDLRWKKNAQLECQQFSMLLYSRFVDWMPEIANWYQANRAQKARLSP